MDISVPEVFLGGIAGATLVFYFSGSALGVARDARVPRLRRAQAAGEDSRTGG